MSFARKFPLPGRFILFVPLLGMAIFVALYMLAAFQYPGGSWRFPEAEGFSFWNNYLCDLLDRDAINGMVNEGRHAARAALASLVGALLVIWLYLPRFFPIGGLNQEIMWVSGLSALITTFFLSTHTHDFTVRIAGVLGFIAFISLFVELFKIGLIRLLTSGMLCLLVMLVNYYIYETGDYITALPVIQKITFTAFISWFVVLNLAMVAKLSEQQRKLQ